MNYAGALVIVSHDRDFLQGLTKKVYEFRDHKLKLHLGDVNSYLEARRIENLQSLDQKSATSLARKKEKNQAEPKAHTFSKEEQRQLDNRRKKLEKLVEELESQIASKESKIAEMERMISDPANIQKQQEILAEYQQLKTALQQEMTTWETHQGELEEILAKMG
jgi:ATP-binding cassette subfamily F protein 3